MLSTSCDSVYEGMANSQGLVYVSPGEFKEREVMSLRSHSHLAGTTELLLRSSVGCYCIRQLLIRVCVLNS